MRLLSRLVSAALLLSACDSTKAAGEVCETTDECGNLKCVSPKSGTPANCARTGTDICSDFCTKNEDCAAVAAGMVCVTQCDNIGICKRP
jgi:hypothetical protein